MGRLLDSIARLNAAVDQLDQTAEAILARQRAAAEGLASPAADEAEKLRAALASAERDRDRLRDLANGISSRLDAATLRLRTLLEG